MASPTGKAQVALYKYYQAAKKQGGVKKLSLNDLAKREDFRGVHWNKIVSAAGALDKKGLLKVSGTDIIIEAKKEAWRAGRKKKHYRPDLSRSEIDKIVDNLQKQGWQAKGHPPFITTNAPEDQIDDAYSMKEITAAPLSDEWQLGQRKKERSIKKKEIRRMHKNDAPKDDIRSERGTLDRMESDITRLKKKIKNRKRSESMKLSNLIPEEATKQSVK